MDKAHYLPDMEIMLKITILSMIIGVSIVSGIILASLSNEMSSIERISIESELSPCEVLTNEMIQARNVMKQYALNPDQFSAEEAQKINSNYLKELNRITAEFSEKGCDENVNEWITPELTQKVIDQTGG